MLISGILEVLNFREINVTHLFIDILTIIIILMILINAFRVIVLGSNDNKIY